MGHFLGYNAGEVAQVNSATGMAFRLDGLMVHLLKNIFALVTLVAAILLADCLVNRANASAAPSAIADIKAWPIFMRASSYCRRSLIVSPKCNPKQPNSMEMSFVPTSLLVWRDEHRASEEARTRRRRPCDDHPPSKSLHAFRAPRAFRGVRDVVPPKRSVIEDGADSTNFGLRPSDRATFVGQKSVLNMKALDAGVEALRSRVQAARSLSRALSAYLRQCSR